jgi:biopolymer transport protein ExbB
MSKHPLGAAGRLTLCVVLLLAFVAFLAPRARSQQEDGPTASMDEAERLAEERLADDASDDAAEPTTTAVAPAASDGKRINWLELLAQGGPLMWPIGGMSILVLAFGIERAIGLRRRKVLPPELVEELGDLSEKQGGLDPRKAYQVCQKFPSAAANVIRAALLKVGRPHSEVEQAVLQASEREAAKLYANVRPIQLGISVTPLLGLLGTVQGMIEAFFVTASGGVGMNKAESLAHGIYTALVTTLAGLSVAIPAALLAHYFEGLIQSRFREIDELLLGMLPQLERFEGKLRVSRVEKKGQPHEVELQAGRRPREPAAVEPAVAPAERPAP